MRITGIGNISFKKSSDFSNKPREQKEKKELTPQERFELELKEKERRFKELIKQPQKFSKKG